MSDLFHERVSEDFIARVFEVMARCPQHTFQVLTKREYRMRWILERLEWEVRDRVKYDAIARTLAWPLPNIWLGVSVENQETAIERIPYLLDTPASVRFLSCEPLLDELDLSTWLWGREPDCDACPRDIDCECGWNTRKENGQPSIDWVIAGGESGSSKVEPCNPEWVRSLRDQCIAASVPFFFKQWGHFKPIFSDAEITISGRTWPAGSFGGCWETVGKKKAGRELDGRTWEQWPA